jgi:magnesium-transporting ATPase (P-type)
MKSIPLLRSCQVILILVQIVGLALLGDLCTGFQSAKSCQSDKDVYGIERYCLPVCVIFLSQFYVLFQLGIRDIKTLFKSDTRWTAAHYVLLYTGIWMLIALADLVFAILFCLEKHDIFRKNAGVSFYAQTLIVLLVIVLLCCLSFRIGHSMRTSLRSPLRLQYVEQALV